VTGTAATTASANEPCSPHATQYSPGGRTGASATLSVTAWMCRVVPSGAAALTRKMFSDCCETNAFGADSGSRLPHRGVRSSVSVGSQSKMATYALLNVLTAPPPS
jgi:hypothetical protein